SLHGLFLKVERAEASDDNARRSWVADRLTKQSEEKRSLARSLFFSRRLLRHLELGAFDLGAFLLGGLRKALALTCVLALASVARRFAGAVALACIGAHAMTLGFVRGVGCRRDGPGEKHRGGNSSERGTRCDRDLHVLFS